MTINSPFLLQRSRRPARLSEQVDPRSLWQNGPHEATLARRDSLLERKRVAPRDVPNRIGSRMISRPEATLERMGWSPFFAEQIEPGEKGLAIRRVSLVHRTRIEVLDPAGPMMLGLAPQTSTGDFAVGDWVLADRLTGDLVRRLERQDRVSPGGRKGRRGISWPPPTSIRCSSSPLATPISTSRGSNAI